MITMTQNFFLFSKRSIPNNDDTTNFLYIYCNLTIVFYAGTERPRREEIEQPRREKIERLIREGTQRPRSKGRARAAGTRRIDRRNIEVRRTGFFSRFLNFLGV
jgi:hypothetical protein